MNCNRHPVVKIKKIVNGGYGLGRLADGKKLFVRNALPGETVTVAVNRDKKYFSFGDIVEVVEPSPARVAPPCRFYGRCGGCDLQHSTYDNQCLIKRQIVVELLAGSPSALLRDSTSLVAPVIPAPRFFHYRQRVRLACDQRTGLGFTHFRSHDIVDVDCCLLAVPPLNDCLAQIRKATGFKALAPITEELELLFNPLDERISLLFRVDRPPRPSDRDHGRGLCEQLGIDRVFFSGRQFALQGPFKGGGSREEEADKLLGFQLQTDPPMVLCWEAGGFSQVNITQNFQLIGLVLQLADVSASDHILDLYCGMGNFSLPLAQKAAAVHGIENQGSAIRSGRGNSYANGLANCQFEKNDVAAGCRTLIEQKRTFATVICDPPRRGIAGIVPLIAQLADKKIIYISCDPATLCRDLGELAEFGFTPQSIQPIDMFPQTHHIETVVLLEKHGLHSRKY